MSGCLILAPSPLMGEGQLGAAKQAEGRFVGLAIAEKPSPLPARCARIPLPEAGEGEREKP